MMMVLQVQVGLLSLLVAISQALVSYQPPTPRRTIDVTVQTLLERRTPKLQPVRTRITKPLYVDGQGMAGGSQHLLGDIIRSLQPRYLVQVADAVQSKLQGMPVVDVEEFCAILDDNTTSNSNKKNIIPTWQELETRVSSSSGMTSDGPSAAALIRLFGSDQSPVVTFYRDSAAWCPYCQKVWIALEEKQISYEVIKIDMRCYGKGKPEEFLKLQPNGNLPCAILRIPPTETKVGEQVVVRESNDIIDILDQLSVTKQQQTGQSKTPVLRPGNQQDRIRDLCDNGRESLERRLYTRWMWWLTGVRKPEEYKQLFLEHWQEMEDALGQDPSGPYFLGEDLSVVDIRFIPFVERQLASLTYFKGADYLRDVKLYPNIVRWLEAMESRPSYQATKSDYYTHSRALPPQLAADCVSAKGSCEELQSAIDNWSIGDGSNPWVEPGWQWYDVDKNAAKEAATKLIRGNKKIVAFCARGAGVAGLPAASAPLADPSATPNELLFPAIDLLLRHIAHSMLNSSGKKDWLPTIQRNLMASDRIQAAVGTLDETTKQALVDCLDYLRERIGVPRDMSYPAAQVLRQALLQTKSMLLATSSSVPTKELVDMAQR